MKTIEQIQEKINDLELEIDTLNLSHYFGDKRWDAAVVFLSALQWVLEDSSNDN